MSRTPKSAGDAECFRAFVSAFGKRAFRRPLSDAELTAYSGLLSFATEPNPEAHDFYTAVDLAVRAMLQDPEFLYRVERARDGGVLDDYGIRHASRTCSGARCRTTRSSPPPTRTR